MDISSYQHMNIRMSTRGKRPLRNLTPSDKVRAIQRIHNGETKASVSRDIGVPESTLRGWCKNEQKLRFMCRQLGMDQLSMDTLENPPEKRSKFENHITSQKFANIPASYEDFAYNRLPLIGVDFTANSVNNNNCSKINKIDNSSSNAFFSEFMKKSNFPAVDDIKLFSSGAYLSGLATLPVSTEYSQLPMIQNLNLLSLLNPSMSAMSTSTSSPSSGFSFSAGSCSLDNDCGKVKVPLRIPNSLDAARDNAKNTSPALSMENWAKDTSENMSTDIDNDSSSHSTISNKNNRSNNKLNMNDTNNNMDVESHLSLAPMAFPHSLFPAGLAGLAQVPPAEADPESGQASQLEWLKIFNASLNIIAFAAAASVLQSQVVGDCITVKSANENSHKTEQMSENILYKQLTKMPHMLNSLSSASYMQSDVSNDSNFDSEPEDLSLRSTTSKLSSPANSRSQSPTKSTASSDTHSDTEQ